MSHKSLRVAALEVCSFVRLNGQGLISEISTLNNKSENKLGTLQGFDRLDFVRRRLKMAHS